MRVAVGVGVRRRLRPRAMRRCALRREREVDDFRCLATGTITLTHTLFGCLLQKFLPSLHTVNDGLTRH